jgi:hypothetical protein
MKTHGAMNGYIHVLLTSTLDGDKSSAPPHSLFTPGERASRTRKVGGWVDPSAGLNAMEFR